MSYWSTVNFRMPSMSILLALLVPLIVDAIPIDNSLIADPTINCLSDSITIDFKAAKPFGGRVFVKGYSKDTNCNIVGDGNDGFSFSIGFDTCGLRRTRELNSISLSTTVVVSFHPIFITKVDRAYRVNCFYTEHKKTLQSQLDVADLTTQYITKQTVMPVCKYEILQGGPTGSPVRYARIGEPVYHKWSCDSETPGIYCMTVHSCSVTDGQGGEPVYVLDKDGCEIDRFVLQNLEYPTDLTAGQSAHVFKFADKPSLHFNCQIELSIKDPKSGCKYLQPQCVPTNGVDGYAPAPSDYSSTTGTRPPPATTNTVYGDTGSTNPDSGDSYPFKTDNNATPVYGDVYTTTTAAPSTVAEGYPGDSTITIDGPGYGPSTAAEIEYNAKLPGAGYQVLPEATSTTGAANRGYDSGYTAKQTAKPTKSGDGYDQTQVPPSSKVVENPGYDEYSATSGQTTLAPVVGYDTGATQGVAALVYNDFYQDEVEDGSAVRRGVKRHNIVKRKVADFDLPEQSIVVIEIDEEDPNSDSSWTDLGANETQKKRATTECVSTGLFAVAAAGASVAFAAGVVALTRRRHTDALRKFVG